MPFKNQDYSDLKAQHDEHNLFEDPEFPATNSSLIYSKNPPFELAGVKWLRPKVILKKFTFLFFLLEISIRKKVLINKLK